MEEDWPVDQRPSVLSKLNHTAESLQLHMSKIPSGLSKWSEIHLPWSPGAITCALRAAPSCSCHPGQMLIPSLDKACMYISAHLVQHLCSSPCWAAKAVWVLLWVFIIALKRPCSQLSWKWHIAKQSWLCVDWKKRKVFKRVLWSETHLTTVDILTINQLSWMAI